ncbi:hypothetical protein DUI87_07649 [Hirundo rustica rustica]|uniref:Uncharacterized protein n=1 Tax=Hirundo rustica rustica TaxID=333673 RepID=A0A3M0L897_HIRRU|nr:hypothetical protein DUI87_07649 [Hirundo rustica rustica]
MVQLMEDHRDAEMHLQPMEEAHARADGCPEEMVSPWETHAGAGSWQDLWTHGEKSPGWCRISERTLAGSMRDPPMEQSVPEMLCPVKGMHTGAVNEGLQWEGLTLWKFTKNCAPWEELQAGAEE